MILATSADPFDIGGTLTKSLNEMVTIMQPVFMIVGGVIVLFGITAAFMALSRGYGRLIDSGWMLLLGLVLIATPALIQVLTAPPSPQGHSAPAHTTKPQPHGSAAKPADLTWLLIALGVLGGLVLLALLITLVVVLVRRAARALRASRARATAQKASRERMAAAWGRIRSQHDRLLRNITHAETDWDALFSTPALTDPAVPETYAMLRAMQAAGTLRDTSGTLPAGLTPDTDLTTLPYPRAVQAFALAWEVALRNAQHIGQNGIPAGERKTIRQIRTLLDLAENSAASPTERTLAYQRAHALIQTLESVHLPPRAIAHLDQQCAPALAAAHPGA